ncbi:hypothetical protein KP509_05G009700 [Ceratopteris richardii]|uniref:Pentatricopeptide repeat-containing protein n=1 Tax=Ceratopteris richardii TaxID=49495 RepID=A0A8T2UVX5_CERRI|nr:hypothetical protein KP509_05G009700 [Ceratopteris richardii]
MINLVLPYRRNEIYKTLQICIIRKDNLLGRELHWILVCYGYESENTFGSQLIRLYSINSNLKEADQVFDQVIKPNLCSWSAIIAGYARVGNAKKTLELYEKMQQCGIKPNNEVFLCMLKVCSSQGLVDIPDAIKLLHGHNIPLSNNIFISLLQGSLKLKSLSSCRYLFELLKCEGRESIELIANQLIRNFAACGSLEGARHVFEMIVNPSMHTWNAIISAHANHGESEHAVILFHRMQEEGIEPDEYIFTCTLKACAAMEAGELGRLLHHQILEFQLESNITVGNALLDLYAKCSDLEDANKVFNSLKNPDIISWGSMTLAFSQSGHDFAVVELYDCMRWEGMVPNRVIFLHVLKACGNIGALQHGRLLHKQVLQHGLQSDALIGSALIEMYATCGNIDDLKNVFSRLVVRDVVSWGAMIGAHVHQGDYQSAAGYLGGMLHEGLIPDAAIFTNMLTSCSHAGLLNIGIEYFRIMIGKCGSFILQEIEEVLAIKMLQYV